MANSLVTLFYFFFSIFNYFSHIIWNLYLIFLELNIIKTDARK